MRRLWILFFVLLLSSCASHRYLNSPGHGAFLRGDYEIAAELFTKEISKGRDNRLLYMLDAGTAHFNAGAFDKAIPHFLGAVKFWEERDYTSVTEEVGKAVVSDNLKTYIGEDYERVLIHTFLALSFLGTSDLEKAQVEARRIDLLLKKMRDEDKKNYKESAFARYLSALLWESSREWDSARIDYEAAFKIDPSFPNIRQSLLKSCVASGHTDKLNYWKKKFPAESVPNLKTQKKSELIVFTTYGLSPVKVSPGGDSTALPVLYPRPWSSNNVEVSLLKKNFKSATTALDMEDLINQFYQEKLKWLAAKKIIKLGAKAGVAYMVAKSTKSEGLGWLTFIALAAMDTADLRGWNTLPAGVKIMRIPVDPGFHEVKLTVKGAAGQLIKEKNFGQMQFLAGQKKFIVFHEK